MAEDYPQHVIKIMSHATGKTTYGFHFLGLFQLVFKLLPLIFSFFLKREK